VVDSGLGDAGGRPPPPRGGHLGCKGPRCRVEYADGQPTKLQLPAQFRRLATTPRTATPARPLQ